MINADADADADTDAVLAVLEGRAGRRRACRQRGQSRGIDVEARSAGTAVDNYEWLHGHDAQFGIIDRDRHIRPSARVLQREALG